jgi:hypothetical protein
MRRAPSSPVPVLAILVAATAHVAWTAFRCDDAYISFRYAVHLAEGLGPVFQAGERVEGFTNPAWVAILAAGARLGVPPDRLAAPLGAILALGGLAVLLERRRRAGRSHVPAGILLASCPGWAAWATGGLETALFTTLVALAYLVLVEELEGLRPAGTGLAANGVLLGVAALTRPEGALLAGATGIFVLFAGRDRGWRAGRLLAWFAAWAGPLLALEVARLAYYGSALPNTFAAKTPGPDLVGPGLRYLAIALARQHLWIPLAALAIAFLRAPGEAFRSAPGRLLAITTIPYLAHVALAGGDFMDGARFVVPILPPLFLAAGNALSRLRRESRAGAIAATAALLAVPVLGLSTTRNSQELWTRHGLDSIGLLRKYTDDWSALGRTLREISRPGDVVATAAAGCVPYHSGLRTIDQHGLVAPDLSQYGPADPPRPGHSLVLGGDALLAARPTWILGSPAVRSRDEPPRANLLLDAASRPALERDYRLVDLRIPGRGGRRCVVALRRDAAIDLSGEATP